MRLEEHRLLMDRIVFGLWGLMNRRDVEVANSIGLEDFSASFVARLIRVGVNRLSSMGRIGLRTTESDPGITGGGYCTRPHVFAASVNILM